MGKYNPVIPSFGHMIHGAVVDHVGHENTRVFKEVSELGDILKKLDDIVGTRVKSEVAFLHE